MDDWLDLGNGDWVRASEAIALSEGSERDDDYAYLWPGRAGRPYRGKPGRWLGETLVALRGGRYLIAYRPVDALIADLRRVQPPGSESSSKEAA